MAQSSTQAACSGGRDPLKIPRIQWEGTHPLPGTPPPPWPLALSTLIPLLVRLCSPLLRPAPVPPDPPAPPPAPLPPPSLSLAGRADSMASSAPRVAAVSASSSTSRPSSRSRSSSSLLRLCAVASRTDCTNTEQRRD